MKKTLCILMSAVMLISSVLTINLLAYALPADLNITASVSELKLAMQSRRDTVSTAVIRQYNSTDEVEELDTKELADTIFKQAISQENSTSSTDGDYLRWNYTDYSCEASTNKRTLGSKVLETTTLSYQINYFTTKEQEDAVTAYIDAFINDSNIDTENEYTQIKLIHDYICNAVDYDFDTAEGTEDADSLSYSAYGAIVNGKAVCQGYALLFYRICAEVGLNCRIIAGEDHMWNIVLLDDGFYYEIDCTWDDTTESNDYFLKGKTDFPDHTRTGEYATESFMTLYPIGESAYVYEPETEPDEPETDPDEPETDPDEPETTTKPGITLPDITLPDITLPTTTEPETEPDEPETDPIEPETDPTEPETDPTDPETTTKPGITLPNITLPDITLPTTTEPKTQPTEPVTESTTPQVVPDNQPSTPQVVPDNQPSTQQETPTTQPTTESTTTTTTAPVAVNKTQATPSGATKVGSEWIAPKQKNTKVKKLAKAKKSFKATWSKVTGVAGYQVQYATDKNFKKNKNTVTISKNKTTSTTVKKLKAKKKYYVRIRTYKNVKLNGKTVKVYSKWSSAKTVTTK